MSANLQNPILTDETKAREWLESAGLAARRRHVRHCGNADQARALRATHGRAHRAGVYQCDGVPRAIHRDGRHRVRALENPAHEMACRAFPCSSSSKKGMSAHQMHRMLDISYKSPDVVHDA